VLVRVLRTDDAETVRAAAASGLGHFAGELVVARLEDALADPSDMVPFARFKRLDASLT
jgi:HEAT repeat protein